MDIYTYIENSNFENRKLIVKMRISYHALEIERGRYNKINREQRICRQCHLNAIEDEEHFFFHCQTISRKTCFHSFLVIFYSKILWDAISPC
jgi:hypothetical protein